MLTVGQLLKFLDGHPDDRQVMVQVKVGQPLQVVELGLGYEAGAVILVADRWRPPVQGPS